MIVSSSTKKPLPVVTGRLSPLFIIKITIDGKVLWATCLGVKAGRLDVCAVMPITEIKNKNKKMILIKGETRFFIINNIYWELLLCFRVGATQVSKNLKIVWF